MGLTLDYDALAAAADWDRLAPEVRGLTSTLRSTRFPGAVFPAHAPNGDLLIYAAAATPAEWRKLNPLLLAFAGPTFTDFEGTPTPLDPELAVDQILLAAGIAEIARLRPGRFPQGDMMAVRALLRLATLLECAPDLAIARPEPTARLLATLQDALNGGKLEEAWRIHAVLREESRLDALNLVQLEIQILAGTGDWGAVRWHDRFEVLALAGPSPATAELLLESIYWTAAHDGETGAERAPEVVIADASMAYAQLLLASAPNPSRTGAERLRALLAPAPREGTPPSENPRTEATAPLADPLAIARAALHSVAALPVEGDLAADLALRAAVDALEPAVRDNLLRRPTNRAIWQEVLARTGEQVPPSDWSSWVESLARENFASAEAASTGANAWRLTDADVEIAVARDLAAKIEVIPEGLAEERFCQAIPYLVHWARSDPRWPRQSLCSVYVAVLTRMALSARRGEKVLQSAAGLLEGALQCGLSPAEYRDALDAAQTIATAGLSFNSGYDALEIVETARGVIPAAPEALQTFSVNIVSALAALWSRLSEGQRLSLAALAADCGVALSAAPARAETELDSPALEGKVLGIYTLTEAAARKAEDILKTAIPGLSVDRNHDQSGSSALAAMVNRADLVVVVWASAKHAATEFIKARRGARPLVYAAGRGASSIIRAVEDWSTNEV
jgi:hypothetical protein